MNDFFLSALSGCILSKSVISFLGKGNIFWSDLPTKPSPILHFQQQQKIVASVPIPLVSLFQMPTNKILE